MPRQGLYKLIVFVFSLSMIYYVFSNGSGRDKGENYSIKNSKNFVRLPYFLNYRQDVIYVFTHKKYSQETNSRTMRLVARLNHNDLPVIWVKNMDFFASHADNESVARIMDGLQPIIFINGYVKNSPFYSEIVSEYRLRTAE